MQHVELEQETVRMGGVKERERVKMNSSSVFFNFRRLVDAFSLRTLNFSSLSRLDFRVLRVF